MPLSAMTVLILEASAAQYRQVQGILATAI